eukprot:13153593-Ditylum_brightwellii.AAC.1
MKSLPVVSVAYFRIKKEQHNSFISELWWINAFYAKVILIFICANVVSDGAVPNWLSECIKGISI